MSDKKIKIGFSLDDSAFARVEGKIARLTNQLKGLNAQLGNAQKSASGSVTRALGGKDAGATQQMGSLGGDNKQLDKLTAGYLKQADALKKLADAGKIASESMAKSLESSVSKQMKAIEKLDMSMKKIGFAGGSGGASADVTVRRASGGGAGGGGGFAGILQRAQGFISTTGSLTGGGLGFAGMSGLARMAGPMGLLATGAAAVGNEWYQSPYRFQRREVEDFTRKRAYADRAESGDISDIMSRKDVMTDYGKRRDLEEISSRTGSAGFRNLIKGITSLDARATFSSFTDQEIRRTLEKDSNEYIDNNKNGAMARDSTRIQGMINDSMGTVKARRIFGLSGAYKNGTYKSDITRLEGNLVSQGYDLSDASSAITGMAGIGSAAFARRNYYGAMSAQAGLMGSAGMMSANMSKFGQGNQFLDLMRATGAGKTGQMDVTVANTLGEAVVNAMNSQLLGGSTGQGTAQFLGAGVGRGSEGRLTLEQNMRGMQSLEAIGSGNIDSYQKARNLQIAISSGAKNIYAQDYLAQMSTSRMAELVNGNASLSRSEQGMGITKDMVASVFAGKQGSISERAINDPNLAGTSMGKTLAGVQKFGGNFSEYVKSNRGKKGFDTEQAIADYGAFMAGSGAASDLAAGEGAARMMALGGDKLKTGGGRVGGGVAGQVEKDALQAKGDLAKFKAEEEERVSGSASELSKTLELQARITDTAAKNAMLYNNVILEQGEIFRLQVEAQNKVSSGQMSAKQATNWLNSQITSLSTAENLKAAAKGRPASPSSIKDSNKF